MYILVLLDAACDLCGQFFGDGILPCKPPSLACSGEDKLFAVLILDDFAICYPGERQFAVFISFEAPAEGKQTLGKTEGENFLSAV